jgi:hypothetical protein
LEGSRGHEFSTAMLNRGYESEAALRGKLLIFQAVFAWFGGWAIAAGAGPEAARYSSFAFDDSVGQEAEGETHAK